MTDRKINNLNFSEFLNQNLEIILENQMHYSGKILFIGDDYLKIVDKYGNLVFIVIKAIASVRVVE